ncbi:MAG: hypothetical protein H6724_17930 [Sandaracinus sp.]|nr:hypothetical protein [Sandaracinus sp.]
MIGIRNHAIRTPFLSALTSREDDSIDPTYDDDLDTSGDDAVDPSWDDTLDAAGSVADDQEHTSAADELVEHDDA